MMTIYFLRARLENSAGFNLFRTRIESSKGFTLIELLVVILIIGILAAIAIPSFLNQREKGQDACAKSMARTMQTAMETFYIDSSTYATADAPGLGAIENQVTGGKCGSAATITVGNSPATSGACTTGAPGANSYCLSATSAANSGGSTHTFAIARTSLGAISRTCGPVAKGGCISAGTW